MAGSVDDRAAAGSSSSNEASTSSSTNKKQNSTGNDRTCVILKILKSGYHWRGRIRMGQLCCINIKFLIIMM